MSSLSPPAHVKRWLAVADERYSRAVEIAAGMNPAQWAVEERYFEHGESWVSSKARRKFSFEDAPYEVECHDAPFEPEVQTTVFQWASDMGKTAVEANIIGFAIDRDPSKIIVAYPNDASAQTWSKDVLSGLIDATPGLRMKVRAAKSRDSGNTIAHKKFPGGSISCISVQTPSALRQRRARIVIGDEIDAWPGDVGGEGDPVALLFKRSEGYADSVQILSSTPTIKGLSRIENWFERSDKRYWHCPCVKCGRLQILRWKNVIWPEGEHENARLFCDFADCRHPHTDEDRKTIIRRGKWIATAPFKGVRGYHLSGIYSLFPAKKGYTNKLHQMAQDAHDAAHSANPRATLRVWKNTFLAETDEDEAEPRIEWGPIFDRREDYITPAGEGVAPKIILPAAVRVLTAGLDVQGNRFEIEVQGFARDEQSWGIEHLQIPGEPTDERSWDKVEEALLRQYEHASGVRFDISLSFVDSGKWSDFVYRFCKRPRLAGRVFPVKGGSTYGLPIIGRLRKWGRGASGYLIGTDTAKDVIYGRLKLPRNEDGSFPAGYSHFPLTYDAEFFRQLVIERAGKVYVKGQPTTHYFKEHEADRNEALDLRVYALAAFRRERWNFDALDKFVLTAEEERKRREGNRPKPATPVAPAKARNWVTGWR